MNSLTIRTVKGAVIGLVGALSFVALGNAAHAGLEPINIYASDLDTNGTWAFPGATTLDQYGPAALNGVVTLGSSYGPTTGLTLSDALNPGLQTFTGPNRLFNFEYSFTVSGPGDTGGTYVSQLTNISNTIDALDLALYGPSGFLIAGAPGTGPSTGEVLLNYSGLQANTTYILVVSGALDNGATSGSFSGSAEANVSAVPLPGAMLTFGTALLGLVGFAGRKRFSSIGGRLIRHAGGAAAVAVALGLGVVVLASAGSADASAIYTDTASLGTWVPTNPAGPDKFFNGLINTAKPTPLSAPGSVTSLVTHTGTGAFSSFVYDFEFTLTKAATLDATLSQAHTTVLTGAQFELFKGTPGSPQGSPFPIASTVGTGAATGELQLHYADLAAGSYFLQIVGGLLSGKVGTLTGLVSVAAVPVPGALLLFGSALAGLVGVTRRGRKTVA